MNQSHMLEGFEIVASDSVPSITLDNQRRFYINTSARRLMDVKPYERLALAYHPEMKAIAIVRVAPDADEKATSEFSNPAELSTSNYLVDKRYYMSARHFVEQYGYPPEEAPYYFVYERGASDGSVFIFRLSR